MFRNLVACIYIHVYIHVKINTNANIYMCVCTVLDVDIKLKGSIHPILMVVYHFQLGTNPGERDAMTNGLEQDQNDTGSFGDQTQTPGHSKSLLQFIWTCPSRSRTSSRTCIYIIYIYNT